MLKFTLFVAAIALNFPAIAQKTYTPAQLRSMVQNGKYPKQGDITTQTQSISFADCITKVEAVIASVKPNYPTETIVNTNIMRVEKMWTNDAAMTLSCSALDKKITITSASYL